MTRTAGSWLACGLALALIAVALSWAFHRYVGTDAARYVAAGAFPCPWHASDVRWNVAGADGTWESVPETVGRVRR